MSRFKIVNKVNSDSNDSAENATQRFKVVNTVNLSKEKALQEAQQNAVKTASRYQAMTLHERKLQEKEKKDAAAKVYGPPTPFTVKELQNRTRKYGEEGNVTVRQIQEDKKYIDNYIRNLEKIMEPSENDKVLTERLKEISSAFNDELYITDEESSKSKKEIAELEAKLKKAEDIENKTSFAPTNAQRLSPNSPEVKARRLAQKELENYLSSIGYESINELRNVIAAQKSSLHSSRLTQKRLDLSSVADKQSENYDANFEKFAKQGKENKWNLISDLREMPDILEKGEPKRAKLEFYAAKHMTDEEFEIYNYYFGKYGKDKADEYLESIENDLNIIEGREISESKKNNLSKLMFGVTAGLDQFEQGMVNLFNTKDDYIPPSAIQYASGEIRQDLAEDGWGWQIGYDFINTSANMMPSILTSTVIGFINPVAGSLSGAALMGASASGNAYQEMLNMGYDKGQARAYSIAVGASEAALSAVLSGISKLGGFATKSVVENTAKTVNCAVAKWAIEYGGKLLSEGLEEGLQEILDPIFKSWATNTTVEYWGGINWGDVLYSALLGAMSAGLFEVAPGTIKTISSNINAKNLYSGSQKELVAQARELSDGTDAKRLGDKYQKKLDKGKNLSGAQLRQLVEANEEAFTEEDKIKIKAAAELRLGQLGEKGNKTNLAEAIAKTVVGEKLTFTEKSLIENSRYGNRVINEAMPDNVTSGNYASDWARKIGTERLNADVYNLPDADSNAASPVSVNENSNLTQEQKNLNAVLSAATSGMKRSYPLNTTKNSDIIEESSNGGTDNGRERLLRDGSQRFGGEEQNPQVQTGGVPQNSSGASGTAQKNQQVAGSGENLRNQGDNRRLNPSEEQKLEGTVVANEDGTPKAVYHFTDNMKFDTFGEGDIGFHFGSEAQSLKRASDLHQTGRTIKAFLAIKNPIRIPVDIMGWQAAHVALKLESEGYITSEQFETIYSLHAESGGTYNTPAAQELRRILNDKGYDGIVYDNHHEGDGESYIAFYPEQVIILDDGKGNTEATSDTEVASFAPENEQGEVFESGEENNTPETQNPVSGEFEEDFEEENGSFFDEPSAEFPKPNLIEDIGAKAAGVTRYSDGQRLIMRIGKNLGYKVVFDPELKTKMGATSNGKIDFDNKIIYLNPAVSKPLQFIFGHEITHFGTASETFEEFIEPIRKTNLYLKWLQRKTGSDSSSVGLLEGLYRERVMESRKNADPMGAAEAQEEMYADFCGETFFSDGERGLTRLLNSLEGKKRSKVMQFILDFVSYLKEKLSGNKDITFQIIRLESKFADVLKSAKENTAKNSGVKYDIKYPIFSAEETQNNMIELGKMNSVFNISQNKLEKTGLAPSKIFENYFTSLGENIYSETFGDVALRKSSVKSEIRHGITAEKIASIEAIPEVIKKGKVIFFETKKGSDVTRIVVCAPIKIGDEPYYMGVMLQRDSKNQRLYLHNVIIEKEMSIRSQADLLTTGALENNEHLFITTILQKALAVKNKYMLKNEKYSISLDERAEKDTETDSDIGDIPSAMEELMQQYQNGDFGEDIFRARMDEIYNEALNRFGVIPEGENAETPISVPQKISEDKITRRFVRTILETGKLTSDMIADVEGEILLGDMMSYEEVSNETAMKRADRSFERGTAEADWQKVISGGVISETDIAIGEKLLLKAIEDNDRLKVLDLSSELSDIFTRSGRVVQAARMLKKMSGVGRLMTAQRNVTTINQSLAEKYGDRKDIPKVKLDPNLARQLAEAQSFEDTEVVYQNVLQDIAAQVPATVMDKLNAWRYFAMLANPRTHVRNLVSNTVFASSVMIKNILATSAEHLIIRDASKRTKAIFIKKEYLEFAKKDIKSREAKKMLEGKGQLDDKGMIQELRRTFDSDFLENLTKGNSNLLEKEDMWFKSVHYRNALAGFLQARKVDLNNVSEATLLQAREYAVKEAKKATFQDASVLADLLNNIKTPKNRRGDTAAEAVVLAAKIGVEGVLPFKRTPINIVKRGIEYSPLGLAETITVGLFNVCKGKISVSEFCDGLASGITGTALMAIGYFLAVAGFAVGGFGDDEEDKFRQLNGEQEYSVKIFGKSYTVDWAAPAAIPFFIGVELADEIKNGDGLQWRDLGDIAWNTLEPITNLSMLSGLQGLIETVKYVDSSRTFGAMVGDIGISFGMQLVPSFFGGISRTIDNTQRTWYNDKNSQLGNTAQTIKNNMQAKIPGLSFTQAPSIDAWGREKKRGSVGERIAENFISPGYYSEIDYDSADTELMRLAKATGEGVFPKQAEKSFSIGGETKYLTADEWVTFAKAKGEYSFDYIHEFIESDSYEKLTDEQRVKVIDNLYEYAKAKAKTTVSDYDLMKGYKSVTNFERNGGSAVTYYVRRAILN